MTRATTPTAFQLAEFEAVAAEKQLRLLGADDEVIARLRALVPDGSALEPCLCTEADCGHHAIASVFDTLGGERRLGWYPLKAPAGGRIIDKHLTIGEKLDADSEVFRLVDTGRLWLELAIFQKHLATVHEGQPVSIVLGPDYPVLEGTIASISPLVDPATRTVGARIELDNADGALRPGLFASVEVELVAAEAVVAVPLEAVQIVEERDVVFLVEDDGYRARPVRLGRRDKHRVEVLAGLRPGEELVTRGAFELKALLTTRGMDPHAGHGH